MSIAKICLGLACLTAAFKIASAAPAEPPAVSATTVTIPYAELRALWEAAHGRAAAKPVPPLTYALTLSRYAFEVAPDLSSVECRATFEVTTYADGWVAVPLLPAEVQIESVAPEPGALAARDGFYTLFVNGPGKRSVNVRFAARLTSTPGGAPGLRLAVPPALVSEVSFAGAPAGTGIELANAMPAGKSQGIPTYRLGAASLLAFTIRGAEQKNQSAAATWQADAQTVVATEEGRVVCRARLVLSGVEGDTGEAKLALPAAAIVREVESDGVDRWEMGRGGEGQERVVSIRWKGTERAGREVMMLYELPLGERDGSWTLTAPRVQGAVQQRSVFFVTTRAGQEISAAKAAGDADRFPAEPAPPVKSLLGEASYATIPAPPGETTVPVKFLRHPVVATAQARIDEAKFRMRVVSDGSTLTDAHLAVRHDRPVVLRVELPAGSELIGCSLGGAEISPVDRGGGTLEFALPAVTGTEPSRLALAYTGRAGKLAPVAGQVELALPRTELFTSAIGWEVQLPGAYELTAFEGNVEMAPPTRGSTDAGTTLVRLRKELCRGEAPRVALFYKKRSVNP